MGCSFSQNQVVPRGAAASENTTASCLTERQVEILKDTWNMLEEDSQATGMQLLHRFFDNSREIKYLFARFAKDEQDARDADTFEIDDEKLATHAQTMMQALDACIESIGEDESTVALLIETLQSSGESHVTYGVRPYMFKPLWFALQGTLEDLLRDVYAPEIEEAWSALFQFLSDKMIEGMRPHLPADEDTIKAA